MGLLIQRFGFWTLGQLGVHWNPRRWNEAADYFSKCALEHPGACISCSALAGKQLAPAPLVLLSDSARRMTLADVHGSYLDHPVAALSVLFTLTGHENQLKRSDFIEIKHLPAELRY